MDVDEEQAQYQNVRDACAGEAVGNWKYLIDDEAIESQLAISRAGGKLPRTDVCLAEAFALK